MLQYVKPEFGLITPVCTSSHYHQINQFSFPTKIIIKDEIFAHTHIYTYIYGYTGGYLLELRLVVTTGSATSGTGIDHTSAASLLRDNINIVLRDVKHSTKMFENTKW
jgi:hypothetical protein